MKYLKKLLNILRFFNLLEPQRKAVISISKTFAWLMIVVVIIVLFTMPDNLVAVVAAAGGQTIAMLNYSFRRHIYYKEKKIYNDDKS